MGRVRSFSVCVRSSVMRVRHYYIYIGTHHIRPLYTDTDRRRTCGDTIYTYRYGECNRTACEAHTVGVAVQHARAYMMSFAVLHVRPCMVSATVLRVRPYMMLLHARPYMMLLHVRPHMMLLHVRPI